MRIGRMKFLWVKRDPLGRPLHPWEEITLDQLSPEAQKLIAKMARVSARDFFEEVKEEWTEAWSTDIGRRVSEAVSAAQAGVQDTPGDTAPAPAEEASGELLAAIPEQRAPEAVPIAAGDCTGPHYCATSGTPQRYCRESCSACTAPAMPRPCLSDHAPEAPACTGPHICGGQRVGWCRESCTLCSAELGRLARACAAGCARRGGAL